MPGKYLEYIRAGRYVVPVEISFLQAKYVEPKGAEVVTSKWVERHHWKEIKAMLKSAVDLVTKYNEAGTDKISKSHHIAFGQDMGIGYMIHLNKDKCPFVAVLDSKRSYWTDDEDDHETDENVSLNDFGGRHKNYTPTKCYIKVCVIRKTSSQSEDAKKLKKELGVKMDDVRNYFQPINEGHSTSSLATASSSAVGASAEKKKPKKVVKKKSISRKKNKHGRKHHHNGELLSSSEESLMEIPPTTSQPWYPDGSSGRSLGHHHHHEGSKESVHHDDHRLIEDEEETDKNDSTDVIGSDVVVDRLCNFSDSADDVFSNNLFRSWIEDDDDEDLPELPDIEETDVLPFQKGRRGNKKGAPRKKPAASPVKNSHLNCGLPDIDEPNKGGRTSKNRRKRNVAIVEPMKPVNKSLQHGQMSFEEAIGAYTMPVERRRKGRATSSPTIDRLIRSKNLSSAIEILAEDSDLLPIDPPIHPSIPRTSTSFEKRKRPEKPPRKRRTKKRVETSRYERLTPSPFDDDDDDDEENENRVVHSSNESDSEPEMPVLTKMVSTSDEDGYYRNNQGIDNDTPPVSPEQVPPLEREVTVDFTGRETNDLNDNSSSAEVVAANNTIIDRNILSPPPYNHNLRENIPISSNPQIISNQPFSAEVQNTQFLKKRVRYDDSDDITSESAYRKTPIVLKKRRRKVKPNQSMLANPLTNTAIAIRPPPIASPLASPSTTNSVEPSTTDDDTTTSNSNKRRGTSTGDAQTQTVSFRRSPMLRLRSQSPRHNLRSHAGTPPVFTNPEIGRLRSESPQRSFRPTMRVETPVTTVPNPVEEETEIQEVAAVAVPKSERHDESQSYDSDYANGAFSDGDDDDVLFAGQFQANLHKVNVGSPEEVNEEAELFSFERPAAVPLESHSTYSSKASSRELNLSLLSRSNAAEDEYTFDYGAASVARIAGAPQAAPQILETFQNPEPVAIRSPENEFHSDGDIHDDEHDNHESVSSLTTYQLMNHPSTLKAGFGLLTKVMTNTLGSSELCDAIVRREISKGNKKKKKTAQQDTPTIMPPPAAPNKRALSPDICSLNPEEMLFKNRPKKKKSVISTFPNIRNLSSDEPGPSSGIRQSFNSFPPSLNCDLDDDDEDEITVAGEPYLREFMSRTREPENSYEPQGDEFDLSQRSHCYLNVFQNYAEKSRHYKKHVKNITELTTAQIIECFEQIKGQIQGIFDGSISSERNQLYISKYQKDKQRLRGLYLLKPFRKEQGNVLTTCLNDFLVPQQGSRLQYTDYINYVMLPEAFIRIFSIVNEVTYGTAEKEMQRGPFACEGPLES